MKQSLRYGHSENSEADLVYAMQDRYTSFSLELQTVLKCLATAEAEGYVPKIPAEWWENISL